MTTLFLDQIDKDDVSLVGGKAANLGELIRQQFPVPAGFVVTTAAYRDFVSSLTLPESLGELADFRTAIIETPLPHAQVSEIEQSHLKLAGTIQGDFVYAVRSSATAEDMLDASFAGQHETYYYVEAPALPLMIRKCWASLWSDAAFRYRSAKGITHGNVEMAVIIQRMVRSDVSGVTFTADPVSGSDSVVITDSAWGMGAAIVDGRVSPDQFVMDKQSSQVTSTRIADKRFMVSPKIVEPSASRLQMVPTHLRNAESLSMDQVQAIGSLALKSEAWFGVPQDLEWSIEGDEIFLLQSRPITSLGETSEEPPRGKFILFKPIAENFTDPLTPLTADILKSIFSPINVIYGRIYMRYGIARSVLPFRMSEEDVARMAYLSDVPKARLSLLRLIPFSILLFFGYLAFGVLYMRTANMPAGFMDSFRARCRKVASDPSLDVKVTLRQLLLPRSFFESIGNMPIFVNISAPRYIFLLQVLKVLLKRWAPNSREDAASFLASGDPEILSTQMGRQIWQLAKLAKSNEKVSQTLAGPDAAAALTALKDFAEGKTFLTELQHFLDQHGHRALKEFELNSVRWEEDPAPVIAMIRNYLASDVDPEAAEEKVQAERVQLLAEIRSSTKGYQSRLITHLAARARYFVRLRENSRFYHIMVLNEVRKKILATEAQLISQGRLKCKDDIFYLAWDEISDLTSGRTGWAEVEDTIRARRMEHIRLGKFSPPRTIGIRVTEAAPTEGTETLKGQGAAPGVYEGRARVIMDPALDAELHPGEILVAPYTDPAWTPLFLTAHAAVVEVGSYLSHAGTIAREYGMPCVVDVTGCTRKIKTGDLIRVDGSLGQITLLEGTDV